MSSVTREFLSAELTVAEQLRTGRATMLRPQDLPGRYGRVIRAIDHLLQAIGCPAIVAGGWAVWRHGYLGRVTQDVDVVVPADRLDEFLRVAAVSRFEVLHTRAGNWPKLRHKDTDIDVDILPEGGTPGTPTDLAPTTIPHPTQLGSAGNELEYITLCGLIELKLAARRARDEADVVELICRNPDQTEAIRQHLMGVHERYVVDFDRLKKRAEEEMD